MSINLGSNISPGILISSPDNQPRDEWHRYDINSLDEWLSSLLEICCRLLEEVHTNKGKKSCVIFTGIIFEGPTVGKVWELLEFCGRVIASMDCIMYSPVGIIMKTNTSKWVVLPGSVPLIIPIIMVDWMGRLRSNPPPNKTAVCIMVSDDNEIKLINGPSKKWAIACRYVLGEMQKIYPPEGHWIPTARMAHNILITILPKITVCDMCLPILNFEAFVNTENSISIALITLIKDAPNMFESKHTLSDPDMKTFTNELQHLSFNI